MSMQLNRSMRALLWGLNYAPQAVDTGKCAGELAEWLAQRGRQSALHTSLH